MMSKRGIPQDVAMQIADDADLPDGAYFAMVEELTGGELDIPSMASRGELPKRDTAAIDAAAAALVAVLREQATLLASYIPGTRDYSNVVGWVRKRTKAINTAADAFMRAAKEARGDDE